MIRLFRSPPQMIDCIASHRRTGPACHYLWSRQRSRRIGRKLSPFCHCKTLVMAVGHCPRDAQSPPFFSRKRNGKVEIATTDCPMRIRMEMGCATIHQLWFFLRCFNVVTSRRYISERSCLHFLVARDTVGDSESVPSPWRAPARPNNQAVARPLHAKPINTCA